MRIFDLLIITFVAVLVLSYINEGSTESVIKDVINNVNSSIEKVVDDLSS